MEQNKKPHSREKKVESGSANVNKGEQVNTGSRPVGGGRPGGPSGQRSGGQPGGQPQRAGGGLGGLPFKINAKTIIILIVAVVVILLLLKVCGGGCDMPDMPDPPVNIDTQAPIGQDTAAPGPNTDVAEGARDKFVTPVGNGNDKVTIMIYMCGTDLESKYGMATADLKEMMNATISDKVNIIIETGGCNGWKNNQISNSVNQIWRVRTGGIEPVESSFGTQAMTDPTNLTKFINYCGQHYPADRNILIFWDHGGGSLSGYGYDEKHSEASSMTLAKIGSALKNLEKKDLKFDFIGFDACLMATLETALVCEPYADYLLASEETEPGTGWYYTNWLSKLSANTSRSTVDIAKDIIDDFITTSSAAERNAKVTLSVMDLSEVYGPVPASFSRFAESTNALIQSDGYTQVSSARAGVRQFAQSSKINQVDLIDFADRLGTPEAQEFAKTLRSAVKYNRSTMSNCYGVSIFFPYETTKNVNSAVASYKAIGLDSDYTKCIQSFASLELGGQVTAAASQTSGSSGLDLGSLLGSVTGGGSTSPLSMLSGLFGGGSGSSSASSSAGFSVDPSAIIGLLGSFSGRSMPTGYEWVDTELVASHAEDIAAKYIDASRITASEKNGKKVLSLTDAEWALIETVELNVFVKDGDGYIDMGLDNTFDMEGNDLFLTYDGTWLTLNDQACAYYLVSDTEQADGTYVTVGRIPCLLNGDLMNLQVVFEDGKDAVVTGAYPMYSDESIEVQAKGMIAVKDGDSIQLLCDYYNADGSLNASFTLNSPITVSGPLKLVNKTLNVDNVNVTYRLTDIYGNHFWIAVN